MSLCYLEKVRILELAKYEYDRIVDDTTAMESIPDEEKIRRIKTLDAIEKLMPELEKIELMMNLLS